MSLIIRGLTNVWASEHTARQIATVLDEDTRKAFSLKLVNCARAGFWQLPDNIFRHEGKKGGGETWRFAHKNSSRFRLVGFVETDAKRDFVALDAFYKGNGDDYSEAQWARMREISEIKKLGDKAWTKRLPQ